MAEEIFIPKLGQTVEEVTLVRWLVPDGARVEPGQALLEVETDKAIFTVEAPASGYLHRDLRYSEGQVVPVLTVVALVSGEGETLLAPGMAGSEPVAEGASVPGDLPRAVPVPLEAAAGTPDAGRIFVSPRARRLAAARGVSLSDVTPTGGGGLRVVERDVLAYLAQAPKASPVAQRVAAESGVDLRQVPGSGPRGTIMRADVERVSLPAHIPELRMEAAPLAGSGAAMASGSAPTQEPAQSAASPSPSGLPKRVARRIALAGVRKIIAERMAASVHTTARVTLITEVDATELVNVRERLKSAITEEWGFVPGYNDLLAFVVVVALREFPYMNARITPDAIEHLEEINLGLAVDTERGLLVPVVSDAGHRTLRELASELRSLVERARAGRSAPEDLAGGTFTITNLGMYEVDAFTPVINLPEAAILGVGRIVKKVVPVEGQPIVRDRLTLSLVFDHRLIDGAPAARFLQYIKRLIEEPYLLLTI